MSAAGVRRTDYSLVLYSSTSEKAYYENARQAHYERFGPLQVGPPTTLLLASKGQEQVAGFPHRYRELC